jgi:phospholipid/cholesterol/gamma-HCH transport system substrate-binding protein
MENRSHAIFAGAFVIALIIAGIVAALWIDRKDVTYTPYKIVSTYSVGGLSMQSDVRYMGVNVGKVLDVGISQASPGSVNIIIGLLPGTPVTKQTWAEVVTQGVTGISNIELRDPGTDTTMIVSQENELYVIPIRPGFFQQLQKLGDNAVKDLDRLMDQVEKVFTDENVKALSQSLKNIQTLTASLSESVKTLDPALKKLPKLIDSFDEVALQVSKVAVQIQASTLPEINQLAGSLHDAVEVITQTARDLKQSPQSIIYGPPKAAPGPGEPGFSGFK